MDGRKRDNIMALSLEETWLKHLKDKKVKLPKESSDTRKALEILYSKIGEFCKRSDIVEQIEYTGGDFQHLKNLKTYGWNVETKGNGDTFGATLLDLNVHPTYAADRKLDLITNWEEKKKYRNYRCFTCGTKENKPIWGNNGTICKLQKGHMNPNEPMTDDNTIPQCQQCNQTSQNDFIFNKWGRPKINKKG